MRTVPYTEATVGEWVSEEGLYSREVTIQGESRTQEVLQADPDIWGEEEAWFVCAPADRTFKTFEQAESFLDSEVAVLEDQA